MSRPINTQSASPASQLMDNASEQHEQLFAETSPSDDPDKSTKSTNIDHYIDAMNSLEEFRCNCVIESPSVLMSESDKDRVVEAARKAINSCDSPYLVFQPNKTGWKVHDHCVRFVVTVIRDQMLRGLLWRVWSRRWLEICNVMFELLVELTSTSFYISRHSCSQ
ncbi:hypothetical protein E4U47_003393 [Claviceps purpurea]|nr:hypothetical protein E4U38_001483 [Claviceps purpurea]KAG6270762.1 hypothetical protein E4U47_003393 [Claviceps purpurea]